MDEIKDIEYGIKKLGVEIANLEKRLVQKKKSGLLYPEEEEELLAQIEDRKGKVSKLESEIRRIQNTATRGQNMNDGVELE
ncbi:MAG: hypothetical protein PHD95_04460 [Candidatus ainarchaeum sp.]|nr:hypothetical protein [Candidatus ainarchaeum sp.]